MGQNRFAIVPLWGKHCKTSKLGHFRPDSKSTRARSNRLGKPDPMTSYSLNGIDLCHWSKLFCNRSDMGTILEMVVSGCILLTVNTWSIAVNPVSFSTDTNELSLLRMVRVASLLKLLRFWGLQGVPLVRLLLLASKVRNPFLSLASGLRVRMREEPRMPSVLIPDTTVLTVKPPFRSPTTMVFIYAQDGHPPACFDKHPRGEDEALQEHHTTYKGDNKQSSRFVFQLVPHQNPHGKPGAYCSLLL